MTAMSNWLCIIAVIVFFCCVVPIVAGPRCETGAGWNCSNVNNGCCSPCIDAILDDMAAIEKWHAEFKLKYPLCDIDKFEIDRVVWGHASLNNCFLCGGQCLDNTDRTSRCLPSRQRCLSRNSTESDWDNIESFVPPYEFDWPVDASTRLPFSRCLEITAEAATTTATNETVTLTRPTTSASTTSALNATTATVAVTTAANNATSVTTGLLATTATTNGNGSSTHVDTESPNTAVSGFQVRLFAALVVVPAATAMYAQAL